MDKLHYIAAEKHSGFIYRARSPADGRPVGRLREWNAGHRRFAAGEFVTANEASSAINAWLSGEQQ